MKLAFIGTGKIISDALGAVAPVRTLEKTAIFARPHSRYKAEELAAQHAIPEIFTDYTELLEKSSADTVYIGLVNSAHHSYAKEALLHGKNVILEKPFAGFYAEAEELIRLAEEKQLFILEAITVMHGGFFEDMRRNLEKLGTVRMVLANYSQYSSRYDAYLAGDVPHAFDAAYYGGALFDIDIYNVYYCVALFGRPKTVHYYPNLGPNGIDISGTLVLSYDGFTAVCTGTKDSDSPCFVSVQGEKGWMRLEGKPNAATSLTTVYVDDSSSETTRDASGAMVRKTITETVEAEKVFHRMSREFEDFARIIDQKDYAEAARLGRISLGVMQVLEAGRLDAGIRFGKDNA